MNPKFTSLCIILYDYANISTASSLLELTTSLSTYLPKGALGRRKQTLDPNWHQQKILLQARERKITTWGAFTVNSPHEEKGTAPSKNKRVQKTHRKAAREHATRRRHSTPSWQFTRSASRRSMIQRLETCCLPKDREHLWSLLARGPGSQCTQPCRTWLPAQQGVVKEREQLWSLLATRAWMKTHVVMWKATAQQGVVKKQPESVPERAKNQNADFAYFASKSGTGQMAPNYTFQENTSGNT